MPFLQAQQPLSRDRLIGALDPNQLGIAQGRHAINQPRGRRAEHHPTRRSDRLHPLSHPHLLTDGGVTEWAGTDFTGDHLARVQAHPQLQLHTVPLSDVDGKPLRLLLYAQRRQAGAESVILQRGWRAEHRHDAVAGETADRAAVPLNHHCRTVDQIGHDLAQPLRTDRRRDVHRMHHIGEQDRDLLVLSRLGGLRESRTALAAELGRRAGLRATGSTEQPRHGQSTATILAGVHVSIVSPLLSDVRHIAVPSPTRSFETLICRLIRDIVSPCDNRATARADLSNFGSLWRIRHPPPFQIGIRHGNPEPTTGGGWSCRFSPRMAPVDRHDLDVSNLSQEAGGPVCLTHHFISSGAGRPPTS